MKNIFKKRGTVFLIFITLLTALTSIAFSRYYSSFHKTIVLKAREPSYTVVFNANGGTGNMADQEFVYGTGQNLLANSFRKNGYSFREWNTSSNGSGTSYSGGQLVNNLSSIDNDEIILYAIWEPGGERYITIGDIVNYNSGLSDNGWVYIGEENGYHKITSIAPLDNLTVWGRNQDDYLVDPNSREHGLYANDPGFAQAIAKMDEKAALYGHGNYSVSSLTRNITIEDIESFSGLTGANCINGSPYSYTPTFYGGAMLNTAGAGRTMYYDGSYYLTDLDVQQGFTVYHHPSTINNFYCKLTIPNPAGVYAVCENNTCAAYTTAHRVRQSYYSYSSNNVADQVIKDIIFGANNNYNYYIASEYIDTFRSDQVMYGFFTVINGKLGNSSIDAVASSNLLYQNGNAYQIRPVIYLSTTSNLVYDSTNNIWNIS